MKHVPLDTADRKTKSANNFGAFRGSRLHDTKSHYRNKETTSEKHLKIFEKFRDYTQKMFQYESQQILTLIQAKVCVIQSNTCYSVIQVCAKGSTTCDKRYDSQSVA